MSPLLTADETRAAEARHEGSMDELMERAGRAVADLVLERFPGLRIVGGFSPPFRPLTPA